MSTILKENLSVDNKGIALIQRKILKEFIDPTLKRIPYTFNDAENQIQIQIGINEKDVEAYIEENPFQRRKFLSFEIIEKKIKKSKSYEDIEKIIKKKLATIDDFSKVSEIIENIKQMYETEKVFRFSFTKSRYLKRFLNKSFDVILSDKKKYLVFDFKSIQDINPRVLNTTIRQGTLLIHKIGPPKVIKYYNNKNYAIFKVFSLMNKHTNNFNKIYDLLITPNENIVNQIYQDKQYDNPNVFFGKYGKDEESKSQNFYISKLKFEEFLKSYGSKFLFVQHKTTGEIFEIPFDEEKYHRFLLDFKYYNDYESLSKAQEKANRGIDPYYSYYEEFLKKTKQKKINYNNQFLESLDVKDLLILIGVKKAIGDNEKTTIEEAFKSYIKTCEEKNKKTFTKNTFESHINTLEEKNLISIRKRKDEKKIYQFLYLKSYSLTELLKTYNEKENLNYILENLEDLDFSTRVKRELFDVDVSVYFMNNMEILVSRDSELEIDYTKNLLQEDLTNQFQNAKEIFHKTYQNLILQKDIYKLTSENDKNLLNLLKELKYKSLLEFNEEFVIDCIYYFSILKKNINFIKNRFEIRDHALLETISIVQGVRNAFRKHFSKESSISHFNSFFNLKFSNFTVVNSQFLYKIQKACQDLIFMFETAQDLKLIREKFKNKFHTNFEFKHIINDIQALIEPKLNVYQDDFDLILSELENGVKKKKEAGNNIDEITKLLTDQLKDSFSNQKEFDNTTKTIADILKAKLSPTFDYTNTIKEIDSYFKQNITSEEEITKVLDYVEGNLRNDFEDKKKFFSILNKIRNIYELKIENTKKYKRIIKHINNTFNSLTIEADVEKIKGYIEKNLADTFNTASQQQNILRQIDQAYKNKMESPNELEDITKLCFAVIRLLLSDTVWHNILTASVFGLFVLAIDKDKDIKLGSICKTLNIQHTSMNLHIKKIIKDNINKKGKQRFEDLKVKNEETREKVRERLVELLMSSQIYLLFKTHEGKTKQTNLKNLTNEFKFRLDFFKRYKQFNKAITKVSDVLINRFIKNYSQGRDFIQDNLSYRIQFFKNYFDESLQNKMPEIKNYKKIGK